MLYVLCLIFALCSFGIVFLFIKEKKSPFLMIMPVYINIVIILVIYTQKISLFGLYGIFGIVPLIMRLKRKNN